MGTIKEAYWNSLLSDATYSLNVNVDGVSGGGLISLLQTSMTEPVATYIAANFSLVTHIETSDVTGSGSDATVWRRTDGKLYVSMQGTEGLQDFLTDTQLALTGNGRDQLVDMANWWFKITTPVGQLARQIKVVTTNLLGEATPVAGQGLVSAAELAVGIEVNGHSLGGYLASAFTRLFGAQAHVNRTTTFNSAGFAPGSESFFQQYQSLIGVGYGLGRFPNQSEQTNYFAQHGISVATNSFWFSQVGQRVELFNEEDATQVGNHKIYKLTDSLALSSVLEKFDPTMTTVRANALLEVGSNRTGASLEGTLDGLRRLLGGTAVSATLVGDAGDSAASRVAYQLNLKTLTDSATFQAIAGKVSLSASGVGLASTARTDFSSLLSLIALSPIALKATAGNEAAVASALQAAWGGAYTAWAADKAMTQTDRDAGKATYTQSYLDDRAVMASWLVYRNALDNTQLTISDANAGEQVFQDVGSLTTIRMGSASTGDSSRRQFLFGGSGADPLSGGDRGDRLYGGAGNDMLSGMGGTDYLEGNDGADILDGGLGDDTLLGGLGADVFVVGLKTGRDTVLNPDAADRVQLLGRTLVGSGTFKSSTNGVTVWTDSTQAGSPITYIHDAAKRELTLEGAGSFVRVKDFDNGELGISVPVAPAPTPPPTPNADIDLSTSYGRNVFFNQRSQWIDTDVRIFNVNSASVRPVFGGTGNDILVGGAASAPWQTFLSGAAGNDRVYSGTEATLADAIAAGEVQAPTGRGIYMLAGKTGDDLLVGAGDDDALFGGEGNDTLVGGSGGDVIFADGNNDNARVVEDGGLSSWITGANNAFTGEQRKLVLMTDALPRRDKSQSITRGAANGKSAFARKLLPTRLTRTNAMRALNGVAFTARATA